MATYYSDLYGGPNPFVACPSTNGLITVVGRVEIPAGTAVATGDVIKLLRVPAGTYGVRARYWNNAWGTDVPGIFGFTTADNDCITADVVLETARATVPRVLVHEDATSAGAVAGTTWATACGALAANDDLAIVIGTVDAGTAAGVKYLTFTFDFVDTASARALNVDYTYNAQSSL